MINKLLFTLIFIHSLYSQYSDVNVKLDARQIRENDRYILENLPEKVSSYFEITQFDQYLDYLNISLTMQFIIESIAKNGNDIIISCQIIASNNSDQYFYSKGANFSYNNGMSIDFSPIFSSLPSLLDYFAYLFIATELDTYEAMGGNLFFTKCLNISDEGIQSEYSRGWEDRKRKCDKIKGNNYLRKLRYNFFVALDELNKENPDHKLISNYMEDFYNNLIEINLNYGKDRMTIYFISEYSHEISKLCTLTNMNNIIELLMDFDQDNKQLYKAYLK